MCERHSSSLKVPTPGFFATVQDREETSVKFPLPCTPKGGLMLSQMVGRGLKQRLPFSGPLVPQKAPPNQYPLDAHGESLTQSSITSN